MKILITGPAGQVAFPLARTLARTHEVWGLARFRNPRDRDLAANAEGLGLLMMQCREARVLLHCSSTAVWSAASRASR